MKKITSILIILTLILPLILPIQLNAYRDTGVSYKDLLDGVNGEYGDSKNVVISVAAYKPREPKMRMYAEAS